MTVRGLCPPAAIFALLLTLAAAECACARSIALLVGVADYGSRANNLEGPANDVTAMRDVLVRRWGFAPEDVHTVIDAQATKAGILAGLQTVQQDSKPGDDVLLYFSGHGTSALNSGGDMPVPHGSGAFIPYGLDTRSRERIAATLLIGRTDLRPRIEALERGQRRIFVVSDSCYSGNQVRSVIGGDELPRRMMPLPTPADERDRRADEAKVQEHPAAAEPYPYHATAYLAAAAEGERAADIPRRLLARLPTVDGKAHGALTDALLRVLEGQLPADYNRDGRLDLTELHRAVTDFMAQRAYGHSPQRLPAVTDDKFGLGGRSVLAATGVAAAPPAGAALEPLRLWLPADAPALADAVSPVEGLRMAAQTDADARVQQSDGHWLLTTAGGDALADMPAGDARRLQAQLRQLVLARRLQQLAQLHRRAALPFEISPALFGGNFHIGQKLYFGVRPDRLAWLVVVNINADARVSLLYPHVASDLRALPAGLASAIPGAAEATMIRVTEPVGMDMQIALAFDERPAGLERLLNMNNVDPGDSRLRLLEQWIEHSHGRFASAHTWLRTFAAN